MATWREIYDQHMMLLGYVPETLCELCGRACGRCLWSAVGLPVPGWEAVRRDIRMTEEEGWHMAESYVVLDCPAYRPEPQWWFYALNWDKELARHMAGLSEEERYGR